MLPETQHKPHVQHGPSGATTSLHGSSPAEMGASVPTQASPLFLDSLHQLATSGAAVCGQNLCGMATPAVMGTAHVPDCASSGVTDVLRAATISCISEYCYKVSEEKSLS